MPKSNKPLLTKRKNAWRKQFKPTVVMRGTPLEYNAGVEAKYRQQLMALVRKMTATTERRVRALFKSSTAKEYFGTDASVSSQARILTNQLTSQFEQLFGRKAKDYAKQMAKGNNAASKATLHKSLQKLSGGLSLSTGILTDDLSDVLSASVAENVALIKSIPQQYMKNVQGAVMRSISTGNGLADLVPYLQNQTGVTERRARFIARDQTNKVYNGINRERMQGVGLRQFEWLHSAGEQKPRPLHLQLSGQVFSFDDPPVIDNKTGERGIPGQLPNCGCRMVPVITLDDGNAGGGLSNASLGDDSDDEDEE